MKLTLLKHGLALALLPFLSGCFLFPSVDHTGLLPADIEGQVHTVNCRVVIDYENAAGVPVTDDIIETQQVCSVDAPEIALQTRGCVALVAVNEDNYVSLRGPTAVVTFFEPVSSNFEEDADPCFIPAGTESGEGEVISRTDMLVNSASSELWPDEIGKILAKNSLTNSLAVVVDSKISVGAKFLDWRYADTTATGEANFDRFNCKEDKTCDIVLRQISMKLEDFTIVRPTVFAPDVHVRDARLYSVTSHSARVDSDGRFTIDNVNAVITSVIDGDKVNLLSGQAIKISGQFNDNLHSQSHAALTLKIEMKHANERFSISASADFQIRKFPSKLAIEVKKPMCLTGGALAIYREARVSECDLKQPYQTWYLEQKGRYLRITQPLNNTCLNVKSDSQNYDGGLVSIVNCSDHYDQLWSIDHDFNVVNLHTRKCLDVGRNKDRGEDDLVTIHSCDLKASGQDWFVSRPG
jgi:hypothetical protein